MRTETGVVAHPDSGGTPPSASGFEQFFRSQYAAVVRIAGGVMGDAHMAEDVAQDVFIAARARFPEPAGSDHAAAWVRTAAAHLALNAVRGRRRRDDRQRRSTTEMSSPAEPEELVIERESESEVRNALARLPRHSATILLLRHSGLSYAEVADAMEIKVNQVGTMLRRAEAALRKEVGNGARS